MKTKKFSTAVITLDDYIRCEKKKTAMKMEDEEDNISIPISHAEDLRPTFPYMKKLILVSRVINMWPKNKKNNSFLHHFGVWIIIVNSISFILTFIIQIKREYKNMDSITALIDFVTVFISGTFRYIYIYVKGDRYLNLVSLIHNNFIQYSIFPTKNRASLDKYYKLANKLILAYGTFTFFWILQVCLMPIISYVWAVSNLPLNLNETEVEPIPYPVTMKVYTPFDYYKQPENALFYLYQIVGFVMFGWIYVVVDSFWYMVILLTIGQFGLIKDSLNTITEILKKDETTGGIRLLKKNQVQEVEKGLKICIKHHQFTRKFVHTLDDISSPNILIDSLHAMISIGFILLDVIIALKIGDWNKVMYSFGYFVTSIVHMFFFDWLGNELAVKEEELADAIYEIPWYKCPTQKSALLLVTIQSRRPYRLTGWRMYKLSLEFFTSTVKAVFSYFTFLFQIRNG